MKLLFKYLIKDKWSIVMALFLAATDQIFINLNPYIFGTWLIDPLASRAGYFRSHGLAQQFFHGVTQGILLIILVSTIAWICKGYESYILNKVIRKFGVSLYNDVQEHVLRLPYADFEDEQSGQTLSLLQRVRSDCENFISKFVNVLFTSLIALGVVIVISYRLSPLLPLVFFTGAVLLSAVTSLLSKKIKIVQESILNETNAMAGSAVESIRNIEIVKSLGLVAQEAERLKERNAGILENELNKIKQIRTIGFVYGAFIQTLHQAIMFLLLIFLFYDQLTVGQLVMMQIYFYFVFGTLGETSSAIVSFHEARASLSKLSEILNKPVDAQPKKVDLDEPVTEIRFQHVTFKYRTSVHNILHDVSFHAKQGESIAIVGPSGSGKSTIIKLLSGLYEIQSGSIDFLGASGNAYSQAQLRYRLGLVTQDAQLFSGTIRDNLLFVRPDASDQLILEVLHKASCQQLLRRSNDHIYTKIGEGGLKLSGGERQRLAIARALLRESNLLVFDEATSSLDSLTEKEITDTIRQITAFKTYLTIVVAHRLSTIMHADRIYVLENGNIVESGSHYSLLQKHGLYWSMWRQQTGEWQAADRGSLNILP
jgi:ATP-binding cassette subfamily B protein